MNDESILLRLNCWIDLDNCVKHHEVKISKHFFDVITSKHFASNVGQETYLKLVNIFKFKKKM